jgi:hypothetical protein
MSGFEALRTLARPDMFTRRILGMENMRNVLVCVLLCLAACSQKAWIDRLSSTNEQHLALETVQELRDGDVGKIARRTDPQLKPELPRGAAEVRPILARVQGPFSIQTVSIVEQSGGAVTKTFTLQGGSGASWALAELVFQGAPRSLQLIGFHAWAASSDPSKLNDFSIGERGAMGFIWLLAMSASAALCIVAVVLIWRRPWLRRRWLWTIGSLFGLAVFGLNWSTGAWGIQLLYVLFLGAGATKAGPFAPWILTVGIPVVAIIVIVRWIREVCGGTVTV